MPNCGWVMESRRTQRGGDADAQEPAWPVSVGDRRPIDDHPEDDSTFVASYMISDPEGTTTATMLTGTDRDDLQITNTGQLSFQEIPDYENPTDSNRDNTYQVTIETTAGSHTTRHNLTVKVTNQDEPEVPPVWRTVLVGVHATSCCWWR